MKNLSIFGNLILWFIFACDIMTYYLGGTNIINNEVNRVFIMWFGFIATSLSIYYLTSEKEKK